MISGDVSNRPAADGCESFIMRTSSCNDVRRRFKAALRCHGRIKDVVVVVVVVVIVEGDVNDDPMRFLLLKVLAANVLVLLLL